MYSIFSVSESNFEDDESEDDFHNENDVKNDAKENDRSDLKIIDLENDDDDEVEVLLNFFLRRRIS
jgi:hypothetical protein